MKTIVEYQCEICKHRYNTEQEASECEAKGLFDFNKFPVGLLSKVTWGEDQYGIFANAQTERYHNEHFASEKNWAYRSWELFSDKKIDLWNWNFCGNGFIDMFDYNQFKKEHLELRETKWLINQLKMNNIQPCYYKNNEIIYI